jgi:ring-1,2-phenylacetyl-CoA epoxidase subunit PaaE
VNGAGSTVALHPKQKLSLIYRMDLLQLRVKKIVRETNDTITIRLYSSDGAEIHYEAGQFLTFIFNRGNHEIRRSYSFSSTPGIDEFMAVTVKRVVNGQVSRFLIDHISRNYLLTSLPPSGRFTIETNAVLQRQIFLIAAGSGITPIFSLLKKILAEEPLTSIFLIYQNHDEKSIIFRKQLEAMEKRHPLQLIWINLLARSKKNLPAKNKRDIETGRLNNFLLEKIINTYLVSNREKLFYICGPEAMMRMAQFTLKLMGFADDQIRKENFTVGYVPPPPLIADASVKEVIIHYGQKTYAIKVAYPTNILQAALNNHIQLPYSCRGGICSTCAAKLMKGKVTMSTNEVLTEKDLQEGLVLTCVGYAETDVELNF